MVPEVLDFLNPTTWPLSPPHEFRIYGDDNAQTYVIVDEEDYQFLIQWKWSWDNPGIRNGKPRREPRLRRNFQTTLERKEYNVGGYYVNPITGNEVRLRHPRVQQTVWLHVVVMLRTGIAPPSEHHHLVDHRSSNHLDCRRSNLRWATGSMNAKNLNGLHEHSLGDW
jgi:hypothetical protein